MPCPIFSEILKLDQIQRNAVSLGLVNLTEENHEPHSQFDASQGTPV